MTTPLLVVSPAENEALAAMEAARQAMLADPEYQALLKAALAAEEAARKALREAEAAPSCRAFLAAMQKYHEVREAEGRKQWEKRWGRRHPAGD